MHVASAGRGTELGFIHDSGLMMEHQQALIVVHGRVTEGNTLHVRGANLDEARSLVDSGLEHLQLLGLAEAAGGIRLELIILLHRGGELVEEIDSQLGGAVVILDAVQRCQEVLSVELGMGGSLGEQNKGVEHLVAVARQLVVTHDAFPFHSLNDVMVEGIEPSALAIEILPLMPRLGIIMALENVVETDGT